MKVRELIKKLESYANKYGDDIPVRTLRGTDYMCKKCYARKNVPNVDQKYFSITAQN